MKNVKRFLVCAVLLGIAVILKFNSVRDDYALVEEFRGAALKEDVFYPMMAQNINETNPLSALINGEVVENKSGGLMLDDSLQPIVSIEYINKYLCASAVRLTEDSFVVQKSFPIYRMTVGEKQADYFGEKIELNTAPVLIDDQLYMGLQDLCAFWDYEFDYDINTRIVDIACSKFAGLPTVYDMRNWNREPFVRDQGNTTNCWAYASIEALESSLMPYQTTKLDAEHVITGNSFGLDEMHSGDYTMALAYFLAWQGPVAEGDEDIMYHLQEAHFYNADDIDSIKWAVFQYGGVTTSIYANLSSVGLSGATNYNASSNSYCYTGNKEPNHDVLIIGWNDDYPAESFAVDVPGDGAFICLNSWGEKFGEDGVFYVSYYDANVGNQAVSYVGVEGVDNYDHIYQSDLCGWTGQLGYSTKKCYGANVFTSGQDEEVVSAGFYALGKNTAYEIYVVDNFTNTASLGVRHLVGTGVLEDAGYYTIRFDEPVRVEKGKEFAIIVGLSTPGNTRPIAIEHRGDEYTVNADLSDGKGYISKNGLEWESVSGQIESNLCIKAYTNDVITEKKK